MRLVMKKTQLKTEEIRMKKVEESLKPTRSNSQLQIKLRRYMSKDTYNLGHAAQNATRALDQIDAGNKDKATEFVDRAELHNNISKRARKAHEIISQELRTRGLKTESTKPMKTLKQILGETDAYEPKSPDEKKFKAKHTIKKTDDVNGNDDKLFKASNVKPVDRETPENHGYNPGTDERVYEDNDALRKKAIKGRAKRETNRFIRDTKKTVAKNLAEASRFRKALDGKRHLSVVKEEKKYPIAILSGSGTGSKLFSHANMKGKYVRTDEKHRVYAVQNTKPTAKEAGGDHVFFHHGTHLEKIED